MPEPSALTQVCGTGRRVVSLPSGTQVEIRRLVRRDLIRLNMLPFPLSEPEKDVRERIRAGEADPREQRAFLEWQDANNAQIVELACVNPRVWFGAPEETPPGAAHYSDFTDADMDALMVAISEFSGWIGAKEAAEAAPFSGRPAGGGAGPAGEAVPEAPA